MNRRRPASTVIPVLYGVQLSDVKYLRGKFGDGFAKFIQRYKLKKRTKWDAEMSIAVERVRAGARAWKEVLLRHKEMRWRETFGKVDDVKVFFYRKRVTIFSSLLIFFFQYLMHF